jgi:hypothetical protein
MTDTPRGANRGSLITGIILIALGTLVFLDRMGVADLHEVFRNLWPMFLVILGLPKLFRRETIWSGLWLITLGVWLQISGLRLFGLTYSNSWPLLLIALGAGMSVRALTDPAARSRRDGSAS